MVVGPFAPKGGQYCHYGLMLSHSLDRFQDAKPDIGEAPLTLISRMRQRACCLLFYIPSRPITPLWIDVTTSAKNISVRTKWLCQSRRAPSEPSETPLWRITQRPGVKTTRHLGFRPPIAVSPFLLALSVS
jgi:hypothetical protein